MIQIQSINMKEVRGLRDLTLTFNQKSYVVSGPNGSGKSGVVDAIEFCLTGAISRLAGKGTAGITLSRHGPHVDRRDDPGAAEVTIHLTIPSLNKSAVITRNMKKPKELHIDPDQPDIRAVLDEVAAHPEVVLSRREIMKYVLAEAGERAKEVQALLRLDRVGQIRSVLGTAHNKLKQSADSASGETVDALTALKLHLDVDPASPENILASVNARRKVLDLPQLDTLTEHTELNGGVESAGPQGRPLNKESALKDVDALTTAIGTLASAATKPRQDLRDAVATIESDPDLHELVRRQSFITTGLDLVDSAVCPLCDYEWADVDALLDHLREKLTQAAAADEHCKGMLLAAAELARTVRSTRALVGPIPDLARDEGEDALETALLEWSADLGNLAAGMASVEGVLQAQDRLVDGWANLPSGVAESLKRLRKTLDAKPDQNVAINAQTFLMRAQDRFSTFRRARQKERAAKDALAAAKIAFETYSAVSENELRSMYESVEGDFSDFYKRINAGDETEFKAKLEPGSGKLELSVDFYGLGMFPPGAYHSEGHQDGMGVCLYLVLMKRLLGTEFTFAVLDDVVMSIDSGHRRNFCKLLLEAFPDTQFIITTHDAIWARQMRTEGLIGSRASVEFHGWSVQTGPVFEPVSEVWDRLDTDLRKNDVPAAAGRLRRHLEYTSNELADSLAAPIPFKGDAGYDLGDLFSAAVGRQSDLLKLAAAAASSWNDTDAAAKVKAMKDARASALASYGGEQWVVNKAVHFNEWATCSKADFTPVVEAVKALLDTWRCPNPDCGSWLYSTPKREPESLRCRCGSININLKKK